MSDVEISVVIPTLGGDCLKGTIERLNEGSIFPKEIIVCIPANYVDNVKAIEYNNVSILGTKVKGQVGQRAEGFNAAKSNLVLQLDDDILLAKDCLENLVNCLKSLGRHSSISPSIKFIDTEESVYKHKSSRLKNIYYWLINGSKGYVPGAITMAGTEIGIDLSNTKIQVQETEWIPGGCVLHYKENLILSNFYPNTGKAFCEDLFHSFYLKSKKIKLFISRDAVIFIDDPRKQKNSWKDSMRFLKADFEARRKYLKITNRSLGFEFYIFYLLRFLQLIIQFWRK